MPVMSGLTAGADPGRPARMHPRERWAILLIGVSGAAFLPGALDRFVFPKLVLVAAGAALALTVPARGAVSRPLAVLLGLAGVVLLAAALAGPTPLQQIIGRPTRYEGIIALPVYLGALAAGARVLGPGRARGSTAWLLDVLAVTAVVIGAESVLEVAGLRPLVSNVARPGSLLGNASDQGAWAVLALGPLAAVAVRMRGLLHRAGAIGAAAALVTSGSRGALVGALAGALVLTVLAAGRRARVTLVAATVLLAVVALALPATRARVLGSTAAARHTVTGRTALWRESVSLVGDHPLLGVGPSGYVDTIPAYHDRRYEVQVGPQNPPDSPHDWLLQAAVAGGIPLLALALAAAGLVLAGGVRSVDTQPTAGEGAAVGGMLAGLAGYAVALLFAFTGPGTTPLAALFAGALVASRPAARPSLAATRGRVMLAGALGALAIVLLAAAVAELPLRAALVHASAGDLAAAERDFDLARDLRPWDPGVAQQATHAYAVLARGGSAESARRGLPWARRELSAYPDSIQGLEDTAALEAAAGQRAAAAMTISQARRLEPANPNLR
jgi:O-antigen ligase